jgi:hypothetical protein
MARSRSCSPPSPPRRVAASEVPSVGAPSSSCKPQPPLNPNAQPFSPSSSARAAGEELPEWLLFNPLLSEGSSSSLGHLVGASPSPSFADVVKGKGMAPQEAPPPSDPSRVRHSGKEPLDSSTPPTSSVAEGAATGGGFMADARRHAPAILLSSPHLLRKNGSLSPVVDPGVR